MLSLLSRMTTETPRGYTEFVKEHLESLRHDTVQVAGQERDAERLCTEVLTDVAMRWDWLQRCARLGWRDASDTYLERVLARRSDQWRSEEAWPVDIYVWQSDEPDQAPPPEWTSAALRMAPHILPESTYEAAPVAEAAIAWVHAHHAYQRRRFIAAVVLLVVVLTALTRIQRNFGEPQAMPPPAPPVAAGPVDAGWRPPAIVEGVEDSPAVAVHGLRKAYGSTVAVADVSVEIPHGEVFALLGPNGAGKTTTVEIMEGFRRRDGGEVRVLGRDPARADAAWRSRIGIVLQGTGEFDELTVGEVVRHFARFYPAADDPAAVIARVGLAGKARARTHSLSGGQKRRLDVALGIIGRPQVLFLDEPTTGFDPQARRGFWELIRGLAGSGTTIVLTTHYLYEAEALADRVGVITGGRLVAVDTPDCLGDRANRPATVSWRGPSGAVESAETANPTALVATLGARFGGEVPELTVARPSLEDVYLSMIGAAQPTDEELPA